MTLSYLMRGSISHHSRRALLRQPTLRFATTLTQPTREPAEPSALTSPLVKYEALCANGTLTRDEHQIAALQQLDLLWHTLSNSRYEPPPPPKLKASTSNQDGGVSQVFSSMARKWGIAMGGGSENPSGAGGVKVSTFGAPKPDSSKSASSSSNSKGGGFFGSLLGGASAGSGASSGLEAAATMARPPVNAPRGLYLYGGVGTGKTFVMDLFFECAPVEAKRRVHFNKFMLDVHARLHRLRPTAAADVTVASGVRASSTTTGGEDPIEIVTRELVAEGWLLCFDEFQVTDIADALLLKRLFESLLAKGAVVVATSNRPPDDLYRNGLQRNLFLPFIALLKELLDVGSFAASRTDYRLVKGLSQAEDTYFLSNGGMSKQEIASSPSSSSPAEAAGAAVAAAANFENLWNKLRNGKPEAVVTLRTQGRAVVVPRAVLGTRLARFTFQQLCGTAVGAADFIAIANAFHTVFLEGIPVLGLKDLNQVRRLIVLIDTLYEHNVKVVILAAAPPQKLFDPSDAKSKDAKANEDANHGDLLGDSTYLQTSFDEVFAFDRTVSRLMEMQSVAYLSEAPGGGRASSSSSSGSGQPGRAGGSQAGHSSSGSNSSSSGHSYNGSVPEAGRDALAAALEQAALVEGLAVEHQAYDEASLDRVWRAYDVDSSGTIDAQELEALLADLEDLRNPTDNATTNSDLKSGKELASDVSSTNEGHARLAPEVLRAYFELMDTDGDGEISRQEFLNFARKTGLRNLLD